MRDAEAGVREMARVTRPGGVVASCVWDYAGEMTLLRAFWDAAREIDPERGDRGDEGVVMRWCGEGELADLWRAAGLRDVRFGSLVVSASLHRLRGPLVAAAHRHRARRRVLHVARRRTAAPRCTTPTGAASGSATARSS